MANSLYYQGFIDTCLGQGLSKSSATYLYKKAADGFLKRIYRKGIFRSLGKGTGKSVKGIEDFATTSSEALEEATKATREGIRRGKKYVGQKARQAREAVGRGARYVSNEFREGYREAIPPPVISKATPGSKGLWHGLGEAATSPLRLTKKFIRKFPVLSTIGGIGLGAYMGDPRIDRADIDSHDAMKARIRTLTPSEKIMYERNASGMNLPGLGLDPMYFRGGGSNDALNYLRL